ncbi:hypothetical protein HAX54_017761 [Datura stramonium]|uniref:K+ potassium transporter integral membrane domain-containing protein n=1 Tax=Datura stramonium TaxID=4076 RepID=A0ABS8ULW6_DATST|nr:hypothetical protein [Datura stramonium]
MRRVQGLPNKDLWPSEFIEDEKMMLKGYTTDAFAMEGMRLGWKSVWKRKASTNDDFLMLFMTVTKKFIFVLIDADVVVVVAVIILVGLFSLQHYGTDRVGWLFAPIVLLWFLLVGGTEALFADLAHFPVSAIQLAFTATALPSFSLF